ncbi:MAG: ATP-binding protein [Ferruginibacter sp.]
MFSEIPAILDDEQGRFWIGTGQELKIFKRNKRTLIPYDETIRDLPVNQSIKTIFEDAEKNIWVGTNAGMYLLKKNTNVFIRPVNFPTSNINCVQQDKNGHIWAGVYYGGLLMYDMATQKITAWSDKQGLPNNNVVSIQEDDKGYLWLATSNGLSRLDIKNQIFQNYTTSDGLPGNEFNYNAGFKKNDGAIVFGGFNGFISFYPNQIAINPFVAPVVFTALKLFNSPVAINGNDHLLNQDISLTSKIVFNHNQDVFTIDFALLSYVKPAKNRYAYKLEGIDKGWNETNIPSITYTHLPEGSYKLLVKGANNDGVWSEPAALQIKILPPLWNTWWAWLLYAVLFLSLLFFIGRFFFLRALIKKEEILHHYKLNFFTNISHEIRTHLALITGPVEKLILSTKDDNNLSKQLLPVKKNADRLLKLVIEQMDFRKAESGNLKLHVSKGNIVSFIDEIYASVQPIALSANIKTTFETSSNTIELYFDRKQMEKVFFNLLTNAFKFTSRGGEVNVTISENKQGVAISITDNGKGIAAENLEKLFDNYYQEDDRTTQNTGYGIGLALAKSIVELHKGTLTAASNVSDKMHKENKTVFSVTLQRGTVHLNNAHFVTADESSESGLVQTILPAIENNIAAENKNAVLAPDKIYTVLLVEDNTEVRDFIRESLDSQYHIIEAANGMRGWESATENIPDLIVSDVMMPEMNGLTLCHQLKKDERTSHIPVILLTAKSSTESQISGLEMGADIYLAKPFSIRVLELHIQNLLVSAEKMRQKFSREFTVKEKVTAPGTIVENKIDQQFLNKAIEIVEEHIDDPEFGVAMFSYKIAMSAPVLYKKLKAVTDMSVNDFIKSLRMQYALTLLQQQKASAYDVAFMVGYLDKKYFIKEFKKYFGKAPSAYENPNEN